MTLQAVEPVRLSVPPQDCWPEPETPTRCQLCPSMLGLQWHHIVRRSATGGPVDWIAIDGLVIWNKLRVCLHCHERINDHRYRIAYEDGEAWVLWTAVPRVGDKNSGAEWWQHSKSGQWFAKTTTIGGFYGM